MNKRKYLQYALSLLLLLALAFLVISCSSGSKATQLPDEGSKLPPGTTEEMVNQTTGSGNAAAVQPVTPSTPATSSNSSSSDASGPGTTGAVAGASFKVVKATRPDNNADVISSGQREVPGDYLEVELSITNNYTDLIDLSEFSFRLWNPGIAADQYEDYYGSNAMFGTYVSENMISAVLLDYANLKPAPYKLKVGETVDQLFLFYDLNPKNVARNQAVTKEGTNLVIHKQRGDSAGEEVEINLAGYPD